jgi:hypothetical protein
MPKVKWHTIAHKALLQGFPKVLSGLYKCFTPLYTDFTKRSSLWTARSPRFLQKKTHFKNSDYVYILCEVSNR